MTTTTDAVMIASPTGWPWPESYVRNCFLDPNATGKMFAVFADKPDVILAQLDGYAIVPRERYEKMDAQIAAYQLGWQYHDEDGTWRLDGALQCLDENLVAHIGRFPAA